MKIVVANSVGKDASGSHIIHFPSRWTASVGPDKWFTYYPYELAYLSSLLKRDTTHDVVMVDGNLRQLMSEAYAALIIEQRPEWLIMEPATMTYAEDLKTALAVKKTSGARIVFCGQHASAFPDEVLADGVDHVCVGEYEYAVLELAQGQDPSVIRGLYPNGRRALLDVNSLPLPEDTDISRRDYAGIGGSRYRELEIFASRGCPMSCVFCVCSNLYYGKPNWRPRDVAGIVSEIRLLKDKYPDTEGFFFNEEEHNAGKNFILELSRAIRNAGLQELKYEAMCGYFTLDQEMMEAMKEAGYYKLRIGIETASENVARQMRKPVDTVKLKKALADASRIGLEMYGTFTFGAPGSNRREDLKTVRLMKELLDAGLLCDGQISLCTPQPGTPFYRWALDRGYLTDRDWRSYDGYSRAVVSYPGYPDTEIEEVVELARRVYSHAHHARSDTGKTRPLGALKGALREARVRFMVRG